MTISFPLNMPSTPNFARFTVHTANVVGLANNPFTLQSQKQEFSGKNWAFDATLPPMTRAQAQPWICFIMSLRGVTGTFLAGDPDAKHPQGSAGGTPQMLANASPGDLQLFTALWTPTQTKILMAGDYLQIGFRLYKVMTDTNSDGSGHATVDIWPSVRESITGGTAISTVNTVGTFRLAADSITAWDIGVDHMYSVSFSATEDV